MSICSGCCQLGRLQEHVPPTTILIALNHEAMVVSRAIRATSGPSPKHGRLYFDSRVCVVDYLVHIVRWYWWVESSTTTHTDECSLINGINKFISNFEMFGIQIPTRCLGNCKHASHREMRILDIIRDIYKWLIIISNYQTLPLCCLNFVK